MREELAALMHEIWSEWARYLFSQGAVRSGMLLVSSEATTRWSRQMKTTYAALSEEEKDGDRREADKVLKLLLGYSREELGSALIDEGNRMYAPQEKGAQ